jgi:hypothetical protein
MGRAILGCELVGSYHIEGLNREEASREIGHHIIQNLILSGEVDTTLRIQDFTVNEPILTPQRSYQAAA